MVCSTSHTISSLDHINAKNDYEKCPNYAPPYAIYYKLLPDHILVIDPGVCIRFLTSG